MTENLENTINVEEPVGGVDKADELPPELRKALNFAWKSEKSPISYTSLEKLYRTLKSKYKNLKKFQVERYLLNEDIFTRFSEKKQKQAYRRIISYKCFELLTSDLLSISNLSKWNDKINYLCIIYDTFSHFLIVACLKDKSTASMKEAFQAALNQPIIERQKDNLNLLLTDLGRLDWKRDRKTDRQTNKLLKMFL